MTRPAGNLGIIKGDRFEKIVVLIGFTGVIIHPGDKHVLQDKPVEREPRFENYQGDGRKMVALRARQK